MAIDDILILHSIRGVDLTAEDLQMIGAGRGAPHYEMGESGENWDAHKGANLVCWHACGIPPRYVEFRSAHMAIILIFLFFLLR